MNRFLTVLALPALAVGLCAAAPQVEGSMGKVLVLGNNSAKACSDHAFLVAEGKMSPRTAVETCTEALSIEALSLNDQAATYNNRGVVRLGMLDEAPYAIDDFNAAVKLEPELAEGYINRGAFLLKEERYADAVVEIDKGLALKPDQPWRAYYNRAVAKENLQDLRGAYADFKKALELKPEWEPAMVELARFTVTRR